MGTRTAHASLMRSAWRMVTAVVTATAATVAVGMTTAAPASAHVDDYPPIPWSVDNVVLIAPQVDFGDGNGLDLFGQPLPGHVIWMIDPDDNSYWPVLDGVLSSTTRPACAPRSRSPTTASTAGSSRPAALRRAAPRAIGWRRGT
jgi:hypothetical protein